MSRLAKWLLLLPLAGALPAAVKLPSVISDHMVLQQGMPVRIWGSADPGRSGARGVSGPERFHQGRARTASGRRG